MKNFFKLLMVLAIGFFAVGCAGDDGSGSTTKPDETETVEPGDDGGGDEGTTEESDDTTTE